jgi:hypothetical protein
MMGTWNELKQIWDGVSNDAPNAPTFAKMEVETQLVGGNEEDLVKFQPTIEVEEA